MKNLQARLGEQQGLRRVRHAKGSQYGPQVAESILERQGDASIVDVLLQSDDRIGWGRRLGLSRQGGDRNHKGQESSHHPVLGPFIFSAGSARSAVSAGSAGSKPIDNHEREYQMTIHYTGATSTYFLSFAGIRYSERSATVGSTFVARSAGMNAAKSDEVSRIRGVVTNTSGSTASTPYRTLWRTC